MRGITVAVVALLLACGVAAAQDTADARARAAYREGMALYEQGRYREAVERLREADDVLRAAPLAFNIAQAYRLSGDCRLALVFYRAYLERDREAANRKLVEDHVAAMERCVAEGERTAEADGARAAEQEAAAVKARAAEERRRAAEEARAREAEERRRVAEEAAFAATARRREAEARRLAEERRAAPVGAAPVAPPPAEPVAAGPILAPAPVVVPASPPPRDPAPGRSKRIAGLVTGAIGVGLVAGGVGFGARAASAADRVTEVSRGGGAWTTELERVEQGGRRDAKLAAIFWAAGGAAVATGVVLVLAGTREEAGARVGVAPMGDGAGVVLTWAR
jgi:hypothetical protein